MNVNIYETDNKSKEWDRSNREEGQDWSKSYFCNKRYNRSNNNNNDINDSNDATTLYIFR